MLLLLLHIDDDEDVRPSALAQAMPSFVKLGVIMPEGVDAEALTKAGKEAESAASAHAAAGRKNQNISVASFAQSALAVYLFRSIRNILRRNSPALYGRTVHVILSLKNLFLFFIRIQ